jgi:hypothetical protein
MGALIVLLAVLLNLSFGQTQPQTPSDTPPGVIDELVKRHKDAIEQARKQHGISKTEGCRHTMQGLRDIAARHGMLKLDGGRSFIQLPDSDGIRLYQVDDNQCQVMSYKVSGALSPPSPTSVAPMGQGLLTRQDLKFGVDVNLFRVLFQLLMYGGGIFWIVRVARNFIEGDMSEAAIAFLQGFIIVGTMYALYRLM